MAAFTQSDRAAQFLQQQAGMYQSQVWHQQSLNAAQQRWHLELSAATLDCLRAAEAQNPPAYGGDIVDLTLLLLEDV